MTDKTDVIATLDDLRKYRTEILEIGKRFRARKVSVFGSLVQGTANEDSDVDFLVEFEPDYKLRDLIRLAQAWQELLGCKVDVADANNLREDLRPYILKDAQLL
jgi:predicted nucleotidyltransferase